MVTSPTARADTGAIRPPAALVALFSLTVALSAFLLFQVQLLITKFILPWFGGVAAVFTTCMLFFQVALLGGYLYSHLLMRLRPRIQRSIHVALLLLSAGVLALLAARWPAPILPSPAWLPSGADAPTWRILLLLAASIGLPFFALSSTSPLLQAWSARAYPSASPYRWYALSNLGSLLGLLTYPVVFEPLLTLRRQAWLWSAAYGVFAAACMLVATSSLRSDAVAGGPTTAAPAESVSLRRRVLWFLLPACAVLALLATTNQVCQEVASVAFLWVLPLTLYLLSFVICFDHPRRYSRTLWTLLMALATAGACFALYSRLSSVGMLAEIAIYAAFLFACCMVCHGEVYRLKPAASRLTGFYLTIAAGGATAGIFVGIVAPRLFSGYWEMHLAVWLVWALYFLVLLGEKTAWLHSPPSWAPLAAFAVIAAGPFLAWYNELAQHAELLVFFVAVLVALVILYRSGLYTTRIKWGLLVPVSLIALAMVLVGDVELGLQGTLARTRNFYGSLAVFEQYRDDPELRGYWLRHGSITHGMQYLAPDRRHLATTYFGTHSGVGLAILNHPRRGAGMRIGVVGLGVGTIATYGQSGDYLRFYEINPAVLRLADTYFSFVKDSPARIDVVLGDARLSLERELAAGHPQRFDVLALDAFNGDSIPVHLLTREAFALYLRHLDQNGILAFHISNRTLDLKPVVQAAAAHFHLAARWIDSTETDDPLHFMSSWVLLSRNPALLDQPSIAAAATPFPSPPAKLWTDDYSNLLSALRR